MTAISAAPSPTNFSSAPLRNRIRVELDASPRDAWALVGDLERFPEYSAGLERVEATRDSMGRCTEYVCHFRAMEPGAPGVVHREVMRWYEANRGYASVATEPNDFGLQHALTLVTIEPAGHGSILTWSQYFDGMDVPAMSAAFDEALADIGARLVARFHGRILERFVQP
jgi:hypothetical protein